MTMIFIDAGDFVDLFGIFLPWPEADWAGNFGILWKHTDLFTGEVDVRRARRLVVSSISTVGNHEYGSFWYFHQDGSIHFENKATGILNTAGLRPGERPDFGTIVSPGVYAHYHRHIFNMRLDMAVDGERNRVVEVDTVALPIGPDNPHGDAFTIRETVLETEQRAQRSVDFNAARFWKIESAASLLSAVVADGMTGRQHRSNGELVAQGVANVGSALFGGICVTGTIARTATNVRAGAKGPVAGMRHSVFLLLFIVLAAPLASYIPLAALAGVLAVVAWNMAERPAFVGLLRSSPGIAAMLLATFVLTVFIGLTEGIAAGLAIALLLHVTRRVRVNR